MRLHALASHSSFSQRGRKVRGRSLLELGSDPFHHVPGAKLELALYWL